MNMLLKTGMPMTTHFFSLL